MLYVFLRYNSKANNSNAALVLVGRLLTERKALQITKFLNRVTSHNINNLLKKISRSRIRVAVG